MSKVNIYKFTIENLAFLYTNHDVNVTSNGLVYEAIRIQRTDIISSVDKDKAQLTISTSKDNPVANFFKNSSMPYATLSVLVQEIPDTSNPDVVVQYFFGEISGCERELNIASYTCNNLGNLINTRMTRKTFQSGCNNFLYDIGCSLNILDYRFTATVLEIKNNGTTLKMSNIIPSGGDPTIYKLTGGIINKNNEYKMIVSVDTVLNEIKLLTRVVELSVGDIVYLAPGCDRTSNRCKEFNNFDNYDGYEFVPNRNKFLGNQ